jgi:hypothetical protein
MRAKCAICRAPARYILVQPRDEKKAENSHLWAPQRAEPIRRIEDYRGRRVILLRVSGDGAPSGLTSGSESNFVSMLTMTEIDPEKIGQLLQ